MHTQEKQELLRARLLAMERVVISFSGGVDSCYLLAEARHVLGENACAVLVQSCMVPQTELQAAADLCTARRIPLTVLPFDPLADPVISANPADRCYHCKTALLGAVCAWAAGQGITHVCEGSNLDDQDDYRPGTRAIRELGVRSPLLEAGLTKTEIRQLSREMGLPGWDKPSAACLASRIPYGEPLTAENLRMAESAEDHLHGLGLSQLRVRVHGRLARIEVLPAELPRLLAEREEITAQLRQFGFTYVTADLLGYRTGSLNETLA